MTFLCNQFPNPCPSPSSTMRPLLQDGRMYDGRHRACPLAVILPLLIHASSNCVIFSYWMVSGPFLPHLVIVICRPGFAPTWQLQYLVRPKRPDVPSCGHRMNEESRHVWQ